MAPSLDVTRFARPLLIGHRGYPAKFPENTLAAFEGAIQAGCDMIELDVTLTRDRKVVVVHDDTLDRTTTGKGPVKDHSFEEIKKLDAGSWFDARFAAQRVPQLSEVVKLTAGRCMLNIEIKESAFEADYPADAIEHQVVNLVKTGGAMDRVIVSSFDPRILQRIAARDAPPALAYISNHGADRKCLKCCSQSRRFPGTLGSGLSPAIRWTGCMLPASRFFPGRSIRRRKRREFWPWELTASFATSCGA